MLKHSIGFLACLVLLTFAMGCPASSTKSGEECSLTDFYYDSVDTVQPIALDQIDLQFELWNNRMDVPRKGRGSTIAEILGIHHPVLDDMGQQTFIYQLSEAECERSERLLKDLIRHTNKILLIGTQDGEEYVTTLLPTKTTRETLADAFALTDSGLHIPPQTVFTDRWQRVILLYPSGVQFCWLADDTCYICTRDWPQRLEGAGTTVSPDFIDACWTIGE